MARTPGGKKPPSGNWVMPIELGNELGKKMFFPNKKNVYSAGKFVTK